MSLGNDYGGVGLNFEYYWANTNASAFGGFGYSPDYNRQDFAEGDLIFIGGIRVFTKGVKHRGFLQLSIGPVQYHSAVVNYGPALSAGYHRTSRQGFTFVVDLGVGFDPNRDEAIAISSFGFGYTWRK